MKKTVEMTEDTFLEEFDDTSTFENKAGLAEVRHCYDKLLAAFFCLEDMRFLASNTELCDVTFLVGETREPVCAVKAVLAARSRWVSFSWQVLVWMTLGCSRRCCLI